MAPSLFPGVFASATLEIGFVRIAVASAARAVTGSRMIASSAAARLQSRYGSVVLDKDHLMAAARYVALNPARARLVSRAQDWRWSSVRAHLDQRDDGLVNVAPLLDRCNGRSST